MERLIKWLGIPAVRAVVHQLVGAALAVLVAVPTVAAVLPPGVVVCLAGAAPRLSASSSSSLHPTSLQGLWTGLSSGWQMRRVGAASDAHPESGKGNL